MTAGSNRETTRTVDVMTVNHPDPAGAAGSGGRFPLPPGLPGAGTVSRPLGGLALSRPVRHDFPVAQLDPAEPRGAEGNHPHPDVVARAHLGNTPNEAFVEGADDRPVRIVGIDPEGTVVEIDRQGLVPTGGRRGSEAEVLECFGDLPGGLLHGRVAQGAGQIPTPVAPFLFGDGDGVAAVGPPDEGDEAVDEHPHLGLATDEGNPQPVALGGPAPTPGYARFLVNEPGCHQFVEMALHGRAMKAQQAGELRNLAGTLLEGFHDGQTRDIPQQVVTLRSGHTGLSQVHGYRDSGSWPFIDSIMGGHVLVDGDGEDRHGLRTFKGIRPKIYFRTIVTIATVSPPSGGWP
jgi:hypothetical protein